MDWLDQTSPVPGGGGAARGGSFYHLSVRSGSRASGACANASYEYITREGDYADRDPATYTESDYMPSWAADNPSEYWDAADLSERANGRLYVSADFALPRDLSPEDQMALAHDLAQELAGHQEPHDNAAVHAPESGGDRERDSVVGTRGSV